MRIARALRTPELPDADAAGVSAGLTPTGWFFILSAIVAPVAFRFVNEPFRMAWLERQLRRIGAGA